jgi:hypothetical protein
MEQAIPPATRFRRHFWPTVAVAAVWSVSALPILLGVAQCPTALLFHVACPGCGMTRALHLIAEGHLAASLALQPFAAPMLLAQASFAAATVVATYLFGVPWAFLGTRWGRVITGFGVAVVALDLVFWIARMFGAFGGPVPV